MYGTEELNEIQRKAVLHTEGAVLVTAGAGSGKTRLLTHRIAHLIKDLGVAPYNILAITFTNKAANEMRSRLQHMLDGIDGIWIFTFHACCVRILRRFIDRIGYTKDFTIYGETETRSVVKRLCKELDLDEDEYKGILAAISDAKNQNITPDDYQAIHKFSPRAETVAKVYAGYQKTLIDNNALDYDDLLLETLRLLKSSAEVREFYQDKFRYIHIDEFQDTNTVQYAIAKILAGKHGNIFAVGDEDQCIYTWRGASIANIFDFQRDFPCTVYKLEQNYRSSANILAVANRIIKGNKQRLDKKLWTGNDTGARVECFGAATEGFEADYVARTIYTLVHDYEFNYSDCAVLLRLNALTRSFEELFLKYGIPHRVFGGIKFYDRKEIKDVLAYARISVNPADDEALYRIINFPRRGIGESSIEKIREAARRTGNSASFVVAHADEFEFGTSLKTKLKDFAAALDGLRAEAEKGIRNYFRYLLYVLLNIDNMFSSKNEDDVVRRENVAELENSVDEFISQNGDESLSDYLQTVSLYGDTDDMNDDDHVTIATVHSAKGLEFPVVFVGGLEEGIFPSLRTSQSEGEHLEEERRLMYVAVTRAKRRLFLTYAQTRFLYGERRPGICSRFLKECGLIQSKVEFSESRADGGYGSADRYGQGAHDGYSPPKPSYGGERFSGTYKSSYGKTEPQKPTESEKDLSKFVAGARVSHKRLGKGTVISVEDVENNIYAKIDFDRGGVMQLAVGFAPLTVIEE